MDRNTRIVRWLRRLALACAVAPMAATAQAQGSGVQQAEVRAIGVDENGWPIFAPAEAPRAGWGDKEPDAAGSAQAQPTARDVPRAPPVERPVDRSFGSAALDSPLREVFRRVGQPADLQDLMGWIAWSRFVLRDHRGAELATREVTHEADVRYPDRDRLLLPGRKIYGREGAAIYAELHRLPMPSYEREAADELDLFGLLLRAPWCFADDATFRIQPQSYITVGRDRMLRIEIHRTPRADAVAPAQAAANALDPTPPVDRFELLCDPDTMDPIELRYSLVASGGAWRRMTLSQYERFGAVRVPMKRVLVDESGNPTVEWTIQRLDTGQRFPLSQFRPMSR